MVILVCVLILNYELVLQKNDEHRTLQSSLNEAYMVGKQISAQHKSLDILARHH